MFLCEFSMTLCLVYKTKCCDQSSNTIQDAIKNKLSTCSLHWDPSDICTKTWTSYLNQTHQSERSFTLFVWLIDSSVCGLCQKVNAHLYWIQCRQDSSSDCNFYLLLTWCDTCIQRNQVSAVKRLNASGRGEKMSCSGVTVPRWRPLAPQIQNELFLELD